LTKQILLMSANAIINVCATATPHAERAWMIPRVVGATVPTVVYIGWVRRVLLAFLVSSVVLGQEHHVTFAPKWLGALGVAKPLLVWM